MSESQVLVERDPAQHVGRVILNRPERKNSYDPEMRARIGAALDELADDDAIRTVVISGTGGVFSTGADMGNAYRWYAKGDELDQSTRRRPSQRRRLEVDRKTFEFYHRFFNYPKITVAEVNGYALGGGFEMALFADIAVVGESTVIGMPATRFLGPALGSLHAFFYRLGPVLTRRLLLTGDTLQAGEISHLGIFTETIADDAVSARADWWARKIARMPADGLAIAKEAFRLIEQTQYFSGEEVVSPLIHAFATNLQFDEGDFNFVKVRAEHGTSEAFALRDAHFGIPEPDITN